MSSEMYCKKIIRYSLPVSCLLSAQSVFAKCGGVDYSWGADALALMHDYVVTMMLYVLYFMPLLHLLLFTPAYKSSSR